MAKTYILLVDDETDLLAAMKELLEDATYRVAAFTSPREALESLASDHLPTLIISDIAMPGMSGIEFLNAVRARPDYSHIPFLFISATTTLNQEGTIKNLPDVTYLRKPFDIDEFYRIVENLLTQ